MAATTTAEYHHPKNPPAIAVKSKAAAMDAIEDITFGSVSQHLRHKSFFNLLF
jgi:hypothetical protein